MPERYLFEYAVVRVVPRVEREEFFNAGVILYCRSHQFLQVRIALPEARLCAFDSAVDADDLKKHLHAFEQICVGAAGAGPIANLDIAARFRWLTATRSTVVQTSRIHPGLCINPADTLAQLYAQLVL